MAVEDVVSKHQGTMRAGDKFLCNQEGLCNTFRPGLGGMSKLALGLEKGTMRASNITHVSTGSQHFNREDVNLGISSITKRSELRSLILRSLILYD